jgi:signal transduction histidine kinase
LAASFDAFSHRLVMTVSDNGSGMDEHTLRHAVDPFFSAKKAGRRQGMGLAKALRWIESSGGSMRIESQPDAGTRAIILVPAAMESAESDPARMKRAT